MTKKNSERVQNGFVLKSNVFIVSASDATTPSGILRPSRPVGNDRDMREMLLEYNSYSHGMMIWVIVPNKY